MKRSKSDGRSTNNWPAAGGAPSQRTDEWKLLVTRCKHITAKHRKNWYRVKFPSSHAEMIADQTNGKTYANCSNSSALAGHSNDAVF
jgi:hypothetical protein